MKLTTVNKCDTGFIWDPLSDLCLIVLNDTRNYWQSIEDCLHVGADLIGFENDKQVLGLIQLFKAGKFVL